MEGQQPPPSSGAGGEPLYRLRVLSEPKGFLRIIEFFLAVFMFATTAGFSSSYSYSVDCASTTYFKTETVSFSYPFKLYTHVYPVYCSPQTTSPVSQYTAASEPEGSARFFVCVGVFAMLYCVAILIWYIFLEIKFLHLDIVPLVDTIVTSVFVLLFFIASCAWSAGLNDVKWWTNFSNIKSEFYADTCVEGTAICKGTKSASYASANVSIIFGFLNAVVWAGNVWFVLKETGWFRSRMAAKQEQALQQKQLDKPTIEPPVNQI